PFRNNFIPSLLQRRHTGPMYRATIVSSSVRFPKYFLYAAPFCRTAPIMRNGSDITNDANGKASGLQRTKRRFASSLWSFHLHLHGSHTCISSFTSSTFSSNLSRKRRAFP